jgi:tetratricopeptide (TPR) repeat protein
MRFADHRARLVLALLAMLGPVLVYHQLGGMDERLHPRSWRTTEAFARYMAGDYRGAAYAYRADLQDRVAIHREHVDPLFAALLEGRPADARSRAEEQLSRGFSADALLTLGELALADGQPQAALDTVQKVLQVERDEYDAWLLASVAYARLRQYPAAVDAMIHALRQNRTERRITSFLVILETAAELGARPSTERPECLLAHYHRYLRIYDRSEGPVAIRHARRAIAANDQPDAAWVTIGLVYRKQGKRDAAFSAYQQATRLNPRNPEAFRQLGLEYSDRGDLVNEARSYRAAFEAAPDDEYHAANLFYVLTEKLGDYQQALALYRTAVTARPDSHTLWGKVGEVEFQLGHFQDALSAQERAVSLAPGDAGHLIHEGWALRALDRPEAALAAFQRSATRDPSASEAYWGLGAAYHRLDRFPEAQNAIERSFGLKFPDPADRLMVLCGLYRRARDFPRTAACLRQMLAMDPKNPWALRWIPDVELNLSSGQASR